MKKTFTKNECLTQMNYWRNELHTAQINRNYDTIKICSEMYDYWYNELQLTLNRK